MTRIDIGRTNTLGYAALAGMEAYVRTHVDRELLELLKLRASILNGCGFCVDMHATAATKHRVSSRKLHAVAAWQHAGDLFDDRERAVLALTDAITRLDADSVTDEIWDALPASSTTARWARSCWRSRRSTSGTASPSARACSRRRHDYP